MDSALAWVGWVAEWLGRFIPRREILDTTEGAVKFIGGNRPVYCGPGVHWWWPWRSTWVDYPIARQTDRLESQTLESRDGRTFLVSGTLTYRVDDLVKLLTTTAHPAQHTILDIAGTALHDVLCAYDWSALQDMQRRGTMKTQLRRESERQLRDYGVTVLKFQLNTLARCRVFKVSRSNANEEA